MKKLLLSIISCMAVSLSLAQAIGDEAPGRKFGKSPNFPDGFTLAEKHATSRAQTVDDLILEPEGRQEPYSMRGIGISSTWGGLQEALMQGATDIVWGDNGKVYIHSPLGAFIYGYAEGTISEDGKQVKVQLPQTVAAMNYRDSEGQACQCPMKLSVMVKISTKEEELEDGPTYIPEPDPEKNVLIYDLSEDGTLTQVSPYMENFEPDEDLYLKYPDEMLSCYLYVPRNVMYGGELDDMIEYWYGYTNLNQVLSPLPKDLIVNEIPNDLEWNGNWAITSASAWNELVQGAIKDNKIYLTNLSNLIPDAVVVGDIEGDKVIFKDKQYMGLCEQMNRYITFRGAYSYINGYNEYTGLPDIRFAVTNEDVVMDYDPSTQTMTLNDGTKGFIMNSLMGDYVYYYCAFDSPRIHLQTNADLMYPPKDPSIEAWNDYSEWYDHPFIGATFRFPELNTNGAVLNYDNLYYRVYFNDELFIFYPDDGFGIEEETDWMCTTFYDTNYRIYGDGDLVMVYFYTGGVTKVGLQSGYKLDDGTMYESNVVVLDMSDGSIDSAIDKTPIKTEAFDLQGRRLLNPERGSMIIEVTTFSDGTISAKKIVR